MARPLLPRSFRPHLESLESREVPSATAATPTYGAALMSNSTAGAQAQLVVKAIDDSRQHPTLVALKVGYTNRPITSTPITMWAMRGAFHEGEILTGSQAPRTGATYYLVAIKEVSHSPVWGGLKLGRVNAWYNGKPTVIGPNYLSSLTAPRWWYDQVQQGDIVREVKRIYGDSWRWGKMNPDPEVERLIYNNGEGLPNVLKGKIQTLGPASLAYNCLAYGATYGTRTDLASIGWIYENGFNLPAGAKAGFRYSGYNDLVRHLGGYGWKPDQAAGWFPGLRADKPYLVLFTNPQGGVTHAAIWTKHGVYAKMGADGLFRFDSLEQLEGRLYGKATQWFSRP